MHHVQDIHSISFQINNFFLFFKPDTPPQKFGEFASKSRFTRFKSHTIQNYQTPTPTPDNTPIHPFAHRNPLQIYSTQTINLGQSSFHRNPHKPTSQTRILKSTIPIKSYLHTEQTSYKSSLPVMFSVFWLMMSLICSWLYFISSDIACASWNTSTTSSISCCWFSKIWFFSLDLHTKHNAPGARFILL